MSTNFHWRTKICSCCGRYDDLHVGKRTFESFSFEGHLPWDDEELRITSWAGYKELLRTTPGELWDENGVQHDVEEFITEVEATPLAGRRRQYDWVREHLGQIGCRSIDKVERYADWLDAEGFSFHGGEFF